MVETVETAQMIYDLSPRRSRHALEVLFFFFILITDLELAA